LHDRLFDRPGIRLRDNFSDQRGRQSVFTVALGSDYVFNPSGPFDAFVFKPTSPAHPSG
jgi:hypothetical protein